MSPGRAERPGASLEGRVRIRMYNVGFGDCFLIRFASDDGVERRILVDCGYHTKGKGAFDDASLVEQIKADLDPNGDGEGRQAHRIDVVIATHRHQDHISGFGETKAWEDIGVEEVWLPFTAKPGASDEHAFLGPWERLIASLPSVVDGAGELTAAAATALGAAPQAQRDDIAFMLWNARLNAPGIENLTKHMKRADGRASKRRYLPEGKAEVPCELSTPALPGVTVHVLGPSKDPKFRGKRTAPAEWGFAAGGAAPGAADSASPFGPEWRVPSERVGGRLPFAASSLKVIESFNGNVADAALAVEGFVNGESLVLVLVIGSARLLLPGDAEVGSWLKILGDPEAVALVESATFLKVGHHGSHNATPLVLVREHLGKRTPAMMSTQQGPGSYRHGIPFDELLEALADARMPLARSDRSDDAGKRFVVDADGKWIDLELEC